AFGGKVENQPRSIERVLHAGQLHAETVFADLEQRDSVRLLLPLLLFETRDDVVMSGEAHHLWRRVDRKRAALGELRDRADDRPQGSAIVVLYDHLFADPRQAAHLQLFGKKRLRTPDGRQFDGNDRRLWMLRLHSCNTNQSATTLTPAFLSSASSARSMASNARTPRSPRYASRRSSADRASGFTSGVPAG